MVSLNIATPTLQIGASGAAVADLQELLASHVAVGGLTIDGDFGQITELAVKVFQHRNFIARDGIVGPQTWNLLLNGGISHLPLLRRGDYGALVERLQRAMTLGFATGPWNEAQSVIGTRGYYFGRVDGEFGPVTEAAVKAFQQTPPFNQPSLSPVDGIVGSQTWSALIGLVTRVSHISL